MKSFSNWTIEEVENEFGLYPTEESPLLDSWMTVESSPTELEQGWLELLRIPLKQRSYIWNEQDLIANFIGPLLRMVNFDGTAYHGFMVRELSAPYKEETLSGEVDFMVAQGRHSPQRLFFFLNEYKREKEPKDPLGQLMIAMVAAQLLNQDENSIYGVYVIGRIWYFVLLDGKAYTVHEGLNAATDEIEQIFGVLRNTKTIIDQIMAANH